MLLEKSMNPCDQDFGFCFCFGPTMRVMGSQFPDQGLNMDHSSEIAKF